MYQLLTHDKFNWNLSFFNIYLLLFVKFHESQFLADTSGTRQARPLAPCLRGQGNCVFSTFAIFASFAVKIRI